MYACVYEAATITETYGIGYDAEAALTVKRGFIPMGTGMTPIQVFECHSPDPYLLAAIQRDVFAHKYNWCEWIPSGESHAIRVMRADNYRELDSIVNDSVKKEKPLMKLRRRINDALEDLYIKKTYAVYQRVQYTSYALSVMNPRDEFPLNIVFSGDTDFVDYNPEDEIKNLRSIQSDLLKTMNECSDNKKLVEDVKELVWQINQALTFVENIINKYKNGEKLN